MYVLCMLRVHHANHAMLSKQLTVVINIIFIHIFIIEDLELMIVVAPAAVAVSVCAVEPHLILSTAFQLRNQ